MRSAYVWFICPFPSFSIRFAAKFTLYVLSEIKGQSTHAHSCLFHWNSISFTYYLASWNIEKENLYPFVSAFLSIVGLKGHHLTETANKLVEKYSLQYFEFLGYSYWKKSHMATINTNAMYVPKKNWKS
jgi:hypothetical protein